MPVLFAQRFMCSVWFFSFVMSFEQTAQWTELGALLGDGSDEELVDEAATGGCAAAADDGDDSAPALLRLSQHRLAWCNLADSV
jgi:hypothetical protein|eukprot:COSAG03_NODE_10_length_23829_cov_21.731395_10_plen_84_part_00